jgi:hypothetical protein
MPKLKMTDKKMQEYLKSHESDIAYEINDFGDLKDIFMMVFDREPEKVENEN